MSWDSPRLSEQSDRVINPIGREQPYREEQQPGERQICQLSPVAGRIRRPRRSTRTPGVAERATWTTPASDNR